MRISFPRGGLSNLPRMLAACAALILPMSVAQADIPPGMSVGGEGGWINVPGGGGGTKPMMVVRAFNFEGDLYFLLADPVTPSICCASATIVAEWASGTQSFAGPETLEFKYNSKVNGVVGEVVVKIDCKNMTPQECAARLARLVIATQKEFKPHIQ